MPITLTQSNMTLPDGRTLDTGRLIQSAYSRSGPARQTINTETPTSVTGLSISFTPISPTSLIVINAYVLNSATYVNTFAIYKDGLPTVENRAYTNTAVPNMQITQFNTGETAGIYLHTVRVSHYETSYNTNARTYAVYALSRWSGTSYNLHINNLNANTMAGFSHMYIFEYER